MLTLGTVKFLQVLLCSLEARHTRRKARSQLRDVIWDFLQKSIDFKSFTAFLEDNSCKKRLAVEVLWVCDPSKVFTFIPTFENMWPHQLSMRTISRIQNIDLPGDPGGGFCGGSKQFSPSSLSVFRRWSVFLRVDCFFFANLQKAQCPRLHQVRQKNVQWSLIMFKVNWYVLCSMYN